MSDVLVFIAILGFVFTFPILIAFRIIKSLKTSGDKTSLRLFVIAGSFALVYFVYAAFYPTDDICIDKYERYTELHFPRSGKFIAKSASLLSDLKGSFNDCFLVEMSHSDYNKQLRGIIEGKKFQPNDSFLVYTVHYRKVMSKAKGLQYAHTFSDGSKAYIFLGFMNDGRSVLFSVVGRQSELKKLLPVVGHHFKYN